MILAKSRQENRDFYEVLDYYLEMIRNLHKKTYDYLAEKKALPIHLVSVREASLAAILNQRRRLASCSRQ